MLRLAAPPGYIGFADARQNRLRESRPVIDDIDRHRVLAPARGDGDLMARELHRVLDEVAEPVQYLGALGDQRLLERTAVGGVGALAAIDDGDAGALMRLARGLH